MVLSFLLSCICVFVIISYNQQLGNSKFYFLIGDSLELYVPTIVQFLRDIINGQSIYYSWTNSFGMNTSMLNAFSSFNVFNILFLFSKIIGVNRVVITIVVLKFGLTGAFSSLFFDKTLNLNKLTSIIFSIFYALCAFQIDSNMINFIWIDGLYLLPLILYFIDLEYKKGRFIVLPILYTYLFITNFYMGYVVGFASLSYFIYLLITKENFNLKTQFKISMLYICSVVLAVLISSFVWLPALLIIIRNYSADSTTNIYLNYNLFELFLNLFYGNVSGAKNNIPDLYSGILCLIFAPLYYVVVKNFKKKIITSVIFGFLILSCFVPFLYLFWHCFDSPDGWLFRFAFLISFALCSIAAVAFDKVRDIGFNKIVYISLFALLLFILSNAVKYIILKAPIDKFIVVSVIINFIVFVTWNILILSLKKFDNKNLKILLILFACLEVISNGIFCFYKDESKHFKEDLFLVWDNSENNTVDYLKADDGFYRVSYNSDIISNSDTMYGYNGDSDFGTSENYSVRKVLSKLGIYTSERVVRNFGTSDLSNMIFGIKYIVEGVNPYTYEGTKFKPEIIENKEFLSVGYLVDDDILECGLISENAFENNNELISCMIGEEANVYKEINYDELLIEDYGISLEYDEENDIFIMSDHSAGDGSLMFVIENTDKDYYFYMNNFVSSLYSKSMIYSNGPENYYDDLGYTSVSYLKKFSLYNDISYVEVNSNVLKDQAFKNYYVSYFDDEQYFKAYSKLKDGVLEVQEFKDGYIKGKIKSNNANKILFTSIPYDKGWRAYIDGNEERIIGLLDNAFIGLEIDGTNEHVVEFKYVPVGVKLANILTIFGIITYIIYIFIMKRKFIKI